MHHQPLPPLDRLQELFQPRFTRGEIVYKKAQGSKKAGAPAGFLTHDKRYMMVGVDNKRYLLHRIIYYLYHGVDPGALEVDHRDGDALDNRVDNLRLATRSQNGQNIRGYRKGLKGAYHSFVGEKKPWMATINKDGVRHYLGSFYTEQDAHDAYAAASKIHHGEFGRTH